MSATPDSPALSAVLSEDASAATGRAADIVRGVQRLMADLGWATLTEVTLASGRRADVLALSARGEFAIVEVKSCLQDYLSDHKWREYADFCDRLYFAVDCDFPQDRLPLETGLIVADRFGGAILRTPLEFKLAPARRKALTLGFARLAAARFLRSGGEVRDPGEESDLTD